MPRSEDAPPSAFVLVESRQVNARRGRVRIFAVRLAVKFPRAISSRIALHIRDECARLGGGGAAVLPISSFFEQWVPPREEASSDPMVQQVVGRSCSFSFLSAVLSREINRRLGLAITRERECNNRPALPIPSETRLPTSVRSGRKKIQACSNDRSKRKLRKKGNAPLIVRR